MPVPPRERGGRGLRHFLFDGGSFLPPSADVLFEQQLKAQRSQAKPDGR